MFLNGKAYWGKIFLKYRLFLWRLFGRNHFTEFAWKPIGQSSVLVREIISQQSWRQCVRGRGYSYAPYLPDNQSKDFRDIQKKLSKLIIWQANAMKLKHNTFLSCVLLLYLERRFAIKVSVNQPPTFGSDNNCLFDL